MANKKAKQLAAAQMDKGYTVVAPKKQKMKNYLFFGIIGGLCLIGSIDLIFFQRDPKAIASSMPLVVFGIFFAYQFYSTYRTQLVVDKVNKKLEFTYGMGTKTCNFSDVSHMKYQSEVQNGMMPENAKPTQEGRAVIFLKTGKTFCSIGRFDTNRDKLHKDFYRGF